MTHVSGMLALRYGLPVRAFPEPRLASSPSPGKSGPSLRLPPPSALGSTVAFTGGLGDVDFYEVDVPAGKPWDVGMSSLRWRD
jgi:hypothetical protein